MDYLQNPKHTAKTSDEVNIDHDTLGVLKAHDYSCDRAEHHPTETYDVDAGCGVHEVVYTLLGDHQDNFAEKSEREEKRDEVNICFCAISFDKNR